uniref:Uncharacterized protein n=1 Tax=Rhizophora mucronata TaxID=61149 RepID=A0A2P2Q3B8_RHIMU
MSLPQIIFNQCYTYFAINILISYSVLFGVATNLPKHSHLCYTQFLDTLFLNSPTLQLYRIIGLIFVQ